MSTSIGIDLSETSAVPPNAGCAAGEIQIIGAGPAGSAAAIAALSEGAGVHILDRCRTARHKVCGEFIPAEAVCLLDQLGVRPEFIRQKPARIRRCALHFGSHVKRWTFPEPAFSLSRLELDRLLLERALSLGARLTRGVAFQSSQLSPGSRMVLAHGRQGAAPKPGRLFGFKAHFAGPSEDTVEMRFSQSGYVGISPIENGFTNVCGIAPENVLRRYEFQMDEFLRAVPALADRLRPLARRTAWLMTGPLLFSTSRLPQPPANRVYPAGDALAFIDPFTGSGILTALLTGRLAGVAAARETPSEEYIRTCQKILGRPLAFARLFRELLKMRLAPLALVTPGSWLYWLTRAQAIA